jgi:hypothetical protein
MPPATCRAKYMRSETTALAEGIDAGAFPVEHDVPHGVAVNDGGVVLVPDRGETGDFPG